MFGASGPVSAQRTAALDYVYKSFANPKIPQHLPNSLASGAASTVGLNSALTPNFLNGTHFNGQTSNGPTYTRFCDNWQANKLIYVAAASVVAIGTTYTTFVDIQGAGILEWLGIDCIGVNTTFDFSDVRLTIDGNVIFDSSATGSRPSVSNAVIIVGRGTWEFMPDTTIALGGAALWKATPIKDQPIPFLNSLKVEVKRTNNTAGGAGPASNVGISFRRCF